MGAGFAFREAARFVGVGEGVPEAEVSGVDLGSWVGVRPGSGETEGGTGARRIGVLIGPGWSRFSGEGVSNWMGLIRSRILLWLSLNQADSPTRNTGSRGSQAPKENRYT